MYPNALHIICERNITVALLLSFTSHQTTDLAKELRATAEAAISEDNIRRKILNYGCYCELVQTILDTINKVTENIADNAAANPIVDAENETINSYVLFMRRSSVLPNCKILHKEKLANDHLSAMGASKTMITAH